MGNELKSEDRNAKSETKSTADGAQKPATLSTPQKPETPHQKPGNTPQKPGSGRAWTTLVICCLVYILGYAARVEPSVLVGELMRDFSCDATSVGSVVSAMYISYVLMQVPSGLIADRFGLKFMVAAGTSICAVGTLVFGAADAVSQLKIGRFLIGLATASAFLCCGKAVAACPNPAKHGILLGFVNVCGVLGGIAGGAPVTVLNAHFGWRNTTYAIAAAIAVLLGLVLFGIKHAKPTTSAPSKSNKSVMSGLGMMLKSPALWLIGIYGAMIEFPITAIAELWGVPFIERRFDVATDVASIVSTAIFVAYGVGGVVSTWLAQKIGWKIVMVASAAGALASFAPAVYVDGIGINACIALMAASGFFGGSNIVCFWVAAKVVPDEFKGTMVGFINMLIMASGVIFQPLLGWLLDFFRHGAATGSGEPIYDLVAYRSTFLFIILGMVAALLMPFFVRLGGAAGGRKAA